MGNPIFTNGFEQIIIDSNTSTDKSYRLIKVPIFRFIPFITKLKIKEINNDFIEKESYINIVPEKTSGIKNKSVKITIKNHKYIQ